VLISGLIAVPVLWICTSVLSAALARYAAVGLIARGLPLIRAMTWLCFPLIQAVSFIDEAVRRLSGANLREQDSTRRPPACWRTSSSSPAPTWPRS
jgi:CBS domain containing-hemolysin-like protein